MKQPAIILLLFCIALALLVVLTDRQPVPQASSQAPAMSAEDAQITQLVTTDCSGCHSLSLLSQNPHSRAGWQRTVEQMIRLGAPLSAENEPAVVDYLARRFGRH